jgi:small subunit ribosomal protein S4e
LNLHDGRNILDGSKYSTGDVVKISLPDQEIIDFFSMKEGNVAMIIGGKHAGEIATIESIELTMNTRPNIVHLENFTTIKEYVFPVGREKAEIEVPKVALYE